MVWCFKCVAFQGHNSHRYSAAALMVYAVYTRRVVVVVHAIKSSVGYDEQHIFAAQLKGSTKGNTCFLLVVNGSKQTS